MKQLTHITDYLFKNAEDLPEKPALIFNDQTVTWAALADKVRCAANAVLKRVEPDKSQQIVGILLPNSIEFLVTYLGIIHTGHIAMPLDPNFKPLEAQTVVTQMKPRFVVTNDHYKDHFDTTIQTVKPAVLLEPAEESTPIRFEDTKQVASMLFTSGTTGNPKAVPYTHRNHLWNIPAVSENWHWTSDDTILLSLPLSHWHGLVMGVDGALYHGNTIYLQERFDAAETVKQLQTGLISLFMHVPIAYSKLVEYADGKTIDIGKVRLCISGSSYLPPAVWQDFKKLYGQEILERYGANEMGLIASNAPEKRLSGVVGRLIDDVEVKFLDTGEIVMRSPGLFPGYWNNEAATNEQRTKDGYWLSGDIGELDSEGYLHLKGRVQEKMKKFGYTVYPRDVEWALMQHPKIDEAAVISIQKEDSLSDEFVYFLVGDVTDSEVTQFAKTQMPSFWRPDRIMHLQEIPRTGRTSKPAIKLLRQMVEPDQK